MSWKKYFRVQKTSVVPDHLSSILASTAETAARYASPLPHVYTGHPSRLQRYYQYDDMDRDSDINAALDTIADFCTQSEEQTEEPLRLNFVKEASETEVRILNSLLNKWVSINQFRSKLWYIFRKTIKYGDAFFLRDPETGEWYWLDEFSVVMVKVDESEKTPTEYIVRNLDFNRAAKFATKRVDPSEYHHGLATITATSARPVGTMTGSPNFAMIGSHIDQRSLRNQTNNNANELQVIDAEHVIHLSLSVGLDINWPFGASILEPIYKTFRQKELLEDAIIIYRVQRAPERRIFYIDVGSMQGARAKAHIQQIKNEIHQRRIPNKTGAGGSILDTAYNPLSMMEDYFFAQTAEGRGSKVETLPGGDNLGEIGDLDYFTRKLARGLRIPPSYLSLTDEGGAIYNDGRVGQALIQEFRFNKFCMRLQNLLAPAFDADFKRFVRENGVQIDEAIYYVTFYPPQNFAKYRQIEVDAQQVGVYMQVAENKRLSERFKLKRFLGLSEDEILENERLWAMENAERIKAATGATPAEIEHDTDLSSVGIRTNDSFRSMSMSTPPSQNGPLDELEDFNALGAFGNAPGEPPASPNETPEQ